MPNGQVKNHSSRTLWVVETDSGSAIAHKLAPGRQSRLSVDADGFRAVDGTAVDGHTSWVKINDFSTADVADAGNGLTRGCVLCYDVQDNEFGNVTFDQSGGWGEVLSISPERLGGMRMRMSPQDFVGFLQDNAASGPCIVQEGIVKVDVNDAQTLLFSPERHCGNWTPIPIAAIQSVEYCGHINCRDHDHPYVRLSLKQPVDNPIASVFSSLLSHTNVGSFERIDTIEQKANTADMQSLLLATQRIDIRFDSNGNGTLSCGAGNFPCQGQPGRRYPQDITITAADKHGTHYSNEFQVWMNYSILIWGQVGIYIHEWPYCQSSGGASAGCVHLCPGSAATVYNWIVGRTRITISYPW